jgi:hypothetical protein
MAETVKLPVIGPTKKNYVMIAGAVIVGFVGYAYWNRSRSAAPLTDEQIAEDIPQDREPPATVVGSQEFDDANVRAIINTNTEWYTAAVDYLSSTGGYDFTFTTITLGKFLARRQLTDAESNLVQAAKGAVGEPPQGGPWPIIRATAPGPTTAGKLTQTWHGMKLTSDTTWKRLAAERAAYPQLPDSVESTKRKMMMRNPTIVARIGKQENAKLKAGWIVIVPINHRAAA